MESRRVQCRGLVHHCVLYVNSLKITVLHSWMRRHVTKRSPEQGRPVGFPHEQDTFDLWDVLGVPPCAPSAVRWWT